MRRRKKVTYLYKLYYSCTGFVKALMGFLFSCVGSWGLEMLVHMPRKIDHYYERCLKGRDVEYDCDGYPVHPDTRERTIRMISRYDRIIKLDLKKK